MEKASKRSKSSVVSSQFVEAPTKPAVIVPSIYDGLNGEVVEQIKGHVAQARQFGESIKTGYIGVGQELAAIKELVEPFKQGGFKAIIEHEFNMTETQAYAMINAGKLFFAFDAGTQNVFSALHDSIKGLLGSPSMPKEVVEVALEVAKETGVSPKVSNVKQAATLAKTGKADKQQIKAAITKKNPRQEKKQQEPTLHRPSDKLYSVAHNTVWNEHMTNELRAGAKDITMGMRNEYFSKADLADMLVLKDAAHTFADLVSKLCSALERNEKGPQQPTS